MASEISGTNQSVRQSGVKTADNNSQLQKPPQQVNAKKGIKLTAGPAEDNKVDPKKKKSGCCK